MTSFYDLSTDGMLETADCDSISPIEMFNKDSVGRDLSRIKNKDTAGAIKESLNKIFLKSPSWLPFAAERYEISKDIHDYVMVPVVIMPSDLPNRNKVAFPFTELTAFNPDAGQLSYQTWVGKPTYEEHINRDITKSKGIILDTALQRMPGRKGNLWKVLSLCAFDRSKDPVLATNIQEGSRKNYSMGALVTRYSCSVCGAHANRKEDLACRETHVKQKGPFTLHASKEGDILGYYNAHNITGFEVSSVNVPAWPSATTEIENHLTF